MSLLSSAKASLTSKIKIISDGFLPVTTLLGLADFTILRPILGRTIELDIYKEAHAGLIVAEVEFDSESESEAFQPPAWFGKEVTPDKRYKNKNLAPYGRW